jgi:phosphate starvation-inducible membrane PsiE
MKTLLSMKSSWSERNYWWNLFSFVIIKTSERTLTTISWKSFISQPRIDRKFDTIENRILHYLLFTCFTTIGGREENKTHFPWLYLIYIYIYINLNFVYITLTLENTKLLFVIVVSLSVECDYQVLNWQSFDCFLCQTSFKTTFSLQNQR